MNSAPGDGNIVKLAAPSDIKAIDSNSTPAVTDATRAIQNAAKSAENIKNKQNITSEVSEKPVARKSVDGSANFKATAKPVPAAFNENDGRAQTENKGSKHRVTVAEPEKKTGKIFDKLRIIADQASNDMAREKPVSAESSTKKPKSAPKLGRMLSGDSKRTPSLLETVIGTDVNGPPTDTDARHVVVQVPTGALPGDILKFRLQHKSGVGEPLVVPITVPNGAMEGATLRVRVPQDIVREGVKIVDVTNPNHEVSAPAGMDAFREQKQYRFRELRRKRQQQLLRAIRGGDNKLVRRLVHRDELRDIDFLHHPKGAVSEAPRAAPSLRTETLKDVVWFETAVGIAAAYNNVGALDILLDAGASVNHTDTRGRTACMMAAAAGSASALRWLCRHRGNLNAAEIATGETAAFFAAANGQTEILRIIGEEGGDLESSCHEGWTPAIAAALDGHVDCLYMLKRFGVDLNLRVRGRSAVEFLEMKLSKEDRDKNTSPLRMALQRKHKQKSRVHRRTRREQLMLWTPRPLDNLLMVVLNNESSGQDNTDGLGTDRYADFVPWCQRAAAIDALEHTRLAAVSLEKVGFWNSRDTEYLNDVIGICRRYLVLQVNRALVEMQSSQHQTDLEDSPSGLVAQNDEGEAPPGSVTEVEKTVAPTGSVTEANKDGPPPGSATEEGKGRAPSRSVTELRAPLDKTTFHYIQKFRKLTERLGPNERRRTERKRRSLFRQEHLGSSHFVDLLGYLRGRITKLRHEASRVQPRSRRQYRIPLPSRTLRQSAPSILELYQEAAKTKSEFDRLMQCVAQTVSNKAMTDRRSDCEFHDVPLQHLWRTMEQAATAPPSRDKSDDSKLIRSEWSVEHITTVLRGTMQCRSMTAAYRCLELLAALDSGIVSVDVTDISRDAVEFAKDISSATRNASEGQLSDTSGTIFTGRKKGVILVHIEDTMRLTAEEGASSLVSNNWEMPWWSYGRNGCVGMVKLYLPSVSKHICEVRITHKDDLAFVPSKDTWFGDDVSGIQAVDSSELWTSFRNLADILQTLGHGDAIRRATGDLLEPPSLLSDDAKFDDLNNQMARLKALHQRDVARLDAENKELRSQLQSAVGKHSELEKALIIATNSMKTLVQRVSVLEKHLERTSLLASVVSRSRLRRSQER